MNFLRSIGRKTISTFEYISDLWMLFYLPLKVLLTGSRTENKETFKIVLNQVIFAGVDALPIIGRVALSLGIIVTVQAVTQLPKVGALELMGKIFSLVIIRELGPLITAFVVTGRSGSAMAAELGNMKISQEVDALEVMGINPLRFLIAPRIIGSFVATVCLSLYFNLVSILGGFIVVAIKLKIPFYLFVQKIVAATTLADVSISLSKAGFFGIIISLVSCYHGLSVNLSSTEVPQAATKAIVNSIVFCLAFNGLVTILFYM